MSKLSTFVAQPQNSLYIFADEQKFISKLGNKAAIVRKKKAMQQRLITTVAVDDGVTPSEAMAQIRNSFENIFGMSPESALVKLANGETVAGKNWAQGVYGIGKTDATAFTTKSGTGAVTINPSNGQIMVNGSPVSSLVTDYTYKGVGKNKTVIPNAYSYTDANGNCYIAQYNKITGKYYACSVTDSTGKKVDANGVAMTAGDTSSIWVSVIGAIQQVIQWIVNLFAGGETLVTAKAAQPTYSDISSYSPEGTQTANINGWLILGLASVFFAVGGSKGLFGKVQKSKKNNKK